VADFDCRYPGFCSLLHVFKRIGLLDTELMVHLNDWSSFAPRVLGHKFAIRLSDRDEASFRSALSDIVDIPKETLIDLLNALSWLGISPTTKTSLRIPIPSKPMAPIDLLTIILSHKLRYQSHERDMVVLMHELTVSSPSSANQPPSEKIEETHTSTLIAYGTPTSSAMARTVGLPVAFATLSVLDGKVRDRGVCGPTSPEVYEAVLDGMESVGLGMKEGIFIGSGSRLGLKRSLETTS